MAKNNKLGETDIKNCSRYCLHDMININHFNLET